MGVVVNLFVVKMGRLNAVVLKWGCCIHGGCTNGVFYIWEVVYFGVVKMGVVYVCRPQIGVYKNVLFKREVA